MLRRLADWVVLIWFALTASWVYVPLTRRGRERHEQRVAEEIERIKRQFGLTTLRSL